MKEVAVKRDTVTYNTMIHMFGKTGHVEERDTLANAAAQMFIFLKAKLLLN